MNLENVLIIGSGISGVGAAKLAATKKYKTVLTTLSSMDKEQKNILINLGVSIEEGQHSNSILNSITLVVKSPGISSEIPLLIQARSQSIPIISEIEFAYRFTNSSIIAITGTNGKTTTSEILYNILINSGLSVDLVGNIGKSFSESVIDDNFQYYIIETSSFQLEDIQTFRPNISIILNLNEDHLDRYHDFQEYINSKLKIYMNQSNRDHCIYFSEHHHLVKANNIEANQYLFGGNRLDKTKCGAWIENNHIIIKTIKNQFTMTIHNLALQGTHNIYNSMAAALAASTIGIKNEIIRQSLSDFKGVEHRLEFVGKISGVNFINDSKATNCNSVYYALDTVQGPIIWICGGVDKGNNYTPLKSLVANKVQKIIYLGSNTKKIKDSFKNIVDDITPVKSMDLAVKLAYSHANPGDTVLLSPACASFNLFKNYQERGDRFKSSVLSI